MSDAVRIRRAGDRGVLLEPQERGDVAALVRMLRQAELPGVEDVLPAATTVLVTTKSVSDRVVVEQQLPGLCADMDRTAADASDAYLVTIAVRYDGSDLDDVATLLGISVDDVVAAHTGTEWRCGFVGFAPGFGYLESADSGLTVPRRTQSRTAVPAGSVALTDGYSAVYPRRSPGGWQIIGTTDQQLWDPSNAHPALLHPGTRVRFTDVSRS